MIHCPATGESKTAEPRISAPLKIGLGRSDVGLHEIRGPYDRLKDYAALAKLILSEPSYAGKTVLVCWNHEDIPQLAAALGVTPEPPKWKSSVYDRVYVISYSDGKATLTTSRYDGK